MTKKKDLSIIILNYNTKGLLKDCLLSLKRVKNEANFEVIVADNGSTDGSIEAVKRLRWVKLVENGQNLGFAAGNNRARSQVEGDFVLFLNTDTIVLKNALKSCLTYLKKEKKVGAVTCKVELANGKLDPDTRRSFPTPWVALTHIVLRLDRLFPRSKLFAKYWYGYLPEDETHEVDVIQGAFFVTRKALLDKLSWLDEGYYLDGEDIDLCWRIKEAGYKVVYYPKAKIIHLKGITKGKQKKKLKVGLNQRLKFRMASVNSMEVFYRKRLMNNYPFLLNVFVLVGIKLLKFVRFLSTVLS